jgi:SAM-dependent methyltransferase
VLPDRRIATLSVDTVGERMETSEAATLIGPAVAAAGGAWADLGAGTGTFTLALARLLGPGGTVYAVDKDHGALSRLAPTARTGPGAGVVPVVADFRGDLALSGLDGVVMANALHFVPADDQPAVVATVARSLRPGGAFVLVEYDQGRGSPWVPHPVPPARFAALARDAGLGEAREVGRRPSRYGPKDIYAAAAVEPA